ncbi:MULTISPECIES: glutathione S-transferase family protein [Marinobacter]|uniref:glutathione S-transferase family protein n=1 Tax=Marinobacter TaxID=2742 RepID=UPI001D076AA3|nr:MULTISPECIES: glutathione S-transferase family protein [Marinobacter]MCK7566047.1 glutathione S-transferase family protein [Marinobacter xestospongiae]UDL06971.1 glutathione S-transferase family protein [Marinobacter sp. CA1]
MYTLYYLPGACSRAILTLLIELDQPVKLIDRTTVDRYSDINPTGQVPVLVDGDLTLREGAVIIQYLLEKHQSQMLPGDHKQRYQFLQDLMFANATVHPAYGRLFFIDATVTEPDQKATAFDGAATALTNLWQIVEDRLADTPYMGGNEPNIVDLLLTVYASWGPNFPVTIPLGPRAERMIAGVTSLPSFAEAVRRENATSNP